jgi:3-carboxy-cis,cis-muconate cycloisomerase
MTIGMFDSFITRGWFAPDVVAIWRDTATLQSWLDVEAALAQAEAGLGLVPADCAATIAARARAELFDLAGLNAAINHAQHPFVPVLKQFEALCGDPAAGFIHLGATTQNIFDTAAALQMLQSHQLILSHLARALLRLRILAGDHAKTLQAGRTHGQHALPMTFGFKLACWIDELDRDGARLTARAADSFVASLGGAIGTGAALNGRGAEVEAGMAALLGLRPAGLASRSSYDRMTDYVAGLGLLSGSLEKIATDIVFMNRTEVGEVAEAFHLGKVGSSTMPQKRNPSTALRLISLGRLLRARIPLCYESMIRMDEGDSSATNVMDVTLPEIAVIAGSMAATFAELVENLVINSDVMARNAALTGGLIVTEAVMMRLTEAVGRNDAHEILYDIAQGAQSSGKDFATVLARSASMQRFSAEEISQMLHPANYTGRSEDVAISRSCGDKG